jgi:hypothetical protein
MHLSGMQGEKGDAEMMDLDHVFKYHAPSQEQQAAYQELRESAKDLAATIQRLVPECADRWAAIRHVREAVMTANAGIALGGKL